MRGLLVKDFRLLVNQKQFLFTVLIIAVVFVAAGQEMSFVVSYCTMLGAFFTISSITYDEYDRGFTFLFTMPVTRKGYVMEKYLFMLLVGGGIWIATTLLGMVLGTMRDPEFAMADWLCVSFAILVVLGILMMLMLPINFKYGAEKSRNATLILMFAIFAVAVILIKFEPVTRLQNNMVHLESIGRMGWLLLGALALVIAAGISTAVSARIMEKKQF